ncbi:hypothetical protein Tcan_11509 [Toxocara canis]|uniref:FLYWCH-type domain-containing protein n=1 Tax=Toxocara canis TaxID=6265 RepID=A0A0B2V2Y9_TOXCA|nr:hypothetical protein Tcan_11509 [Toxocara canis]
MNEEITFDTVKSERGFDNLVYDGHRYRNYRNSTSTDRIVWRCCVRGCNAKAQTTKGTMKGLVLGQHNHEPDSAQRTVEKRMNELKESVNSKSNAKDLIRISKSGLTGTELAKYPQENAVRSLIWRKKRRLVACTNENEQGRQRFVVPDELKQMLEADQALSASTSFSSVEGTTAAGNEAPQSNSSLTMTRCEFQTEMVNRLGAIPVERRGEMRARIERELDILFSQKVAEEVEQVFDETSRGAVMERLLAMITD